MSGSVRSDGGFVPGEVFPAEGFIETLPGAPRIELATFTVEHEDVATFPSILHRRMPAPRACHPGSEPGSPRPGTWAVHSWARP